MVAVLAILVALLFPALQAAQERAKSAGCLGNLRQLHIATMGLANDTDGQLPLAEDTANRNATWAWYLFTGGYLPPLAPMVSGKHSRKHPLFDPGSSVVATATTTGAYGINRNLTGPSGSDRVPSRIVSVSNPGEKFRQDAIEGRHGRKINIITLSGNAQTWNADELPLTSDRWDK